MKRTPMARSKKPMARGKGLRPRSAKRVELYRGTVLVEGRRAFVARILRDRPVCQAGHLIGAWLGKLPIPTWPRRATDPIWSQCTRRSVDVHEILARSAGGSISDDNNVLGVCRTCHAWVHSNPRAAKQLGLLRSRYGADDHRLRQDGSAALADAAAREIDEEVSS